MQADTAELAAPRDEVARLADQVADLGQAVTDNTAAVQAAHIFHAAVNAAESATSGPLPAAGRRHARRPRPSYLRLVGSAP